MVTDLVIKNCKVVTPSETISAGVSVNGGKIVAIAQDHELPDARRTIDAQGHFLLPGAVDPHHHYGFYEGWTEECQKGTMGATFGGITSAIVMTTMRALLGLDSADKVPHPPSAEMYDQARKAIEDNAVIDLGLRPIISDEIDVRDIPSFVDIMGVSSFKFLNHFPRGGRSHQITGVHGMDDGELLTAWEVVKEVGGIAAVHAENPYIIRKYTCEARKRVEREGRAPTLADWESARPNIAEYMAQRSDILLAQQVGLPIYFVPHLRQREHCPRVRVQKEGLEGLHRNLSPLPRVHQVLAV